MFLCLGEMRCGNRAIKILKHHYYIPIRVMKQLRSKVNAIWCFFFFLKKLQRSSLYPLSMHFCADTHGFFRNAFICKYFLLINLHNNYRLSFALCNNLEIYVFVIYYSKYQVEKHHSGKREKWCHWCHKVCVSGKTYILCYSKTSTSCFTE